MRVRRRERETNIETEGKVSDREGEIDRESESESQRKVNPEREIDRESGRIRLMLLCSSFSVLHQISTVTNRSKLISQVFLPDNISISESISVQ